jgi:hypothetical protein
VSPVMISSRNSKDDVVSLARIFGALFLSIGILVLVVLGLMAETTSSRVGAFVVALSVVPALVVVLTNGRKGRR